MLKFSPEKIIYLLFFASGAAGLIYEIVWGRLLVLIFGSTTNSIVAVISAFLGGLAIGSLLFGPIADRLSPKNLIKTYSFLEIGVALTAVSTLILLELVKTFYALFSDGSSVTFTLLFIKFALTIFVLSIPTILMGATLPILVRFAQTQNKSLLKSVSLLYATNTFGGVLGVILAAFVLIELFGLQHTLFIAVFINLTVGIIARLIRVKGEKVAKTKKPRLEISLVTDPKSILVLVAFSLSGLTAIAYEVLWTRMFTPTMGTLIYAFATVLAIYIFGIAVGSLIYEKFAKLIKAKNLAFAICEAGIGLFAIASVILTHKFVIDTSFRIAAIVLPATILMGLTFPVVVSLLNKKRQTGSIVGQSYFANTAGSITGGFLASFLFIPTFGSSRSVVILALVNLAIASIFVTKETKINQKIKTVSFLAVLTLFTFGSALLIFKGDRLMQYTTSLQILTAKFNNIDFAFKEDEVASVFAFRDPKNNDQGLFIDGVSTTARVSETRFMAHIPISLHASPQKVLVIAFGMGTTYRSSLAQGMETDAVELAPSVPNFFHFFHPDAGAVLANPKGRIIINDGRNYALLTKKKYDIITIDPPPPFNTAGSTVLHSKEFYQDLAKILNPEGIVSQWIYYNASREDDIAMAIKSFIDVFPHVLALQKVGSVGGIFLQGSFSPFDAERVNLMFEDEETVNDLEEIIEVAPGGSLKDHVTIELIGDRKSLLQKFSKSPSVSDKHPRTEYFKLRHKFTSAPVLIEENAQKFIEELRANLSQVQQSPQ